ncbi:fibronectin type III domain-containing protein [Shewanella sp. OMA3-2]|nr:fibronectin type III domain-containing protein [Shewanella sp. OMA3-2]UJF23051.1 fibronectin type III domain-containing protein [Shewanella sp. OMA3-2]
MTFNVPMTFTQFQVGEFTNRSDSANYVFTPNTGTAITLADDSGSIVGAIATLNPTDWVGITSLTVSYAGAQDWRLGLDNMGFTADPVVKITSATYDASSGNLVVTGSGFEVNAGPANDVVANKFTLTGEGGGTYTLTDTANVEISSATTFTLALSATDKAAINSQITNKNGAASTGGTTYNLAGAAGFIVNAPADSDLTANTITASNVAVPTISSATYNATTAVFSVTGNGFLQFSGATNDIVANKFTFTGEGDATYTLTDTANVDITSGTGFSLTLSATDKSGVNTLLNKNGTSAVDTTTYNVAAAEDWAAGADPAEVVADLTLNGITVSNVLTVAGAPTIGTTAAGNTQASVAFSAPGSNGGSAITGYTATSSPGNLTGTDTSSPIVVTGLTNGVVYTFTVTATNSVGTSSSSAASNAITPKAGQAITFGNPGAQNFGTTPTLSATSTSSLVPTFTSSTTGVCTITSGGALTFVAEGTCTIDADQAGNSSYLAAPTVTQSFSVNAVVPVPRQLARQRRETLR